MIKHQKMCIYFCKVFIPILICVWGKLALFEIFSDFRACHDLLASVTCLELLMLCRTPVVVPLYPIFLVHRWCYFCLLWQTLTNMVHQKQEFQSVTALAGI